MEVQDSVKSTVSFTRRALYDIMRECKGKKIEEKWEFLGTKLVEIIQCPNDKKTNLCRSLRFFKTQFKQKWEAASRKEERFLRNNNKWLNSSIKFQKFSADITYKPGRPTKPFEHLSERSKRRKTSQIRKQIPAEELIYAAGISQRNIGNTDAFFEYHFCTNRSDMQNKNSPVNCCCSFRWLKRYRNRHH